MSHALVPIGRLTRLCKNLFVRSANRSVRYGFDFIVSLPFASCAVIVAPIFAPVRSDQAPMRPD